MFLNRQLNSLFLGLKELHFIFFILLIELSINLLSHCDLILPFQSIEELKDFIFVEFDESHLNLLIHLH